MTFFKNGSLQFKKATNNQINNVFLIAMAGNYQHNSELKQTDAAEANLQSSIQKDSGSSEFSRPLTSTTLNLNLNRDLPVDRQGVSLLKLPNIV